MAGQVRAGSFFGNAALAVFSSVVARLVALAALAVITRLYSAHDYGVWVLVLAFTGIFLPLTTLRYEIALVLAPGRSLTRRLWWAMLICTGVTVLLAALLVTVLPQAWLLRASGFPADQAEWLLAVPLLLLLLAWQLLLQAWLTREKRFLMINLVMLVQVIVASGSTIASALVIEPRAEFAIAGGIAGQAVAVLMLGVSARGALGKLLRRPDLPSVGRAMRLYRVYPQYVLPYSISVGLTERATQVTLAAMYSVSTLGAYYTARQVVLAPAQIVSASVRNVLLAHGARHASLEQTRPYVCGMVTAFCLAAAPLMAVGLIWLEQAVEVMLGTHWPQLASMAWWCLFPSVILMLTGSMDRLFDLAGRQRLATGLQVVSDLAMVAALAAAWWWEWTGLQLVAALSVTQAAYNVVWLVVVLRVGGVSWGFIGGHFGLFVALLTPSLAVQLLLRSWLQPPAAAGAGVAVAVLVAGAGMWLFLRRFRAALVLSLPS